MSPLAQHPLARRLAELRRPRHLIALAAVLLLCVGLFTWAGLTYLPAAADYSQRQIVNDDYATLTAPLNGEGEIRQRILVKRRIFGVILDVTTYNRVARGTLHLRLYDDTGAEAAACDTDMTKLLDNTFHRFIFDRDINAPKAGRFYELVITSSPAGPEDLVGFHRSEGPAQNFREPDKTLPSYKLDGFTLSQDGQALDSTLALQYVVEYGGAFIYGVFAFFAAFLTVLLMALYVVVFALRAPQHRVFALAALGLGFVFLFLIPPRTAPDEYVHISAAYRYANRVLGVAEPDYSHLTGKKEQPPYIHARAGDEMLLYYYDTGATDAYAWRQLAEGLFAPDPGGDMIELAAREVAVFPPLYALPAAAVVLARLLGIGRVGLLVMGRAANLLFYTFVVSRAIRRMPLAKPMMLAAGLLPMCLQLAASFSCDAYVIALAFYFIASCLDYALVREKIGPRQMALLGLLAVLLAPAKVVYLPLLCLAFLIPKVKFGGAGAAWLSRGAVFALGAAMWLAFTLPPMMVVDGSLPAAPQSAATTTVTAATSGEGAPAEPGAGAEASADPAAGQAAIAIDPGMPLRPNGDAYHTFGISYVFGHIPQTAKLLARSLWEQSPLWLQGLIGGRLGEPIAINIELNWLFVAALLGILLCAGLPAPEDETLLSPKQRLGLAGLAMAVTALLFVACLGWTPVNYKTLFGFQGRYLLPVLPLLLLALRGRLLRFEKPAWRSLAFAGAALVVLCQLNAFTIISQF